MITVDNRFGVVTKVTSRYVVVRSLDGIEAIVPNETLVDHDGAEPFVLQPGRARWRCRSRSATTAISTWRCG